MAPMRARSVRRPSTGKKSSLKSQECSSTPWGVLIAVMTPPGTEWVTGTNSQSKGPMRTRSPSATGMNWARSTYPDSVTRRLARPKVNGVP